MIYEGEFNDGKFEGNGTMIYTNGTIVTGLWTEDDNRMIQLVENY